MELGEPDDSGRRRPVEIKGSEFTMELDVAVISIGNGANPLIPNSTPDMKLEGGLLRRGYRKGRGHRHTRHGRRKARGRLHGRIPHDRRVVVQRRETD
jgi:hypothetical protein